MTYCRVKLCGNESNVWVDSNKIPLYQEQNLIIGTDKVLVVTVMTLLFLVLIDPSLNFISDVAALILIVSSAKFNIDLYNKGFRCHIELLFAFI